MDIENIFENTPQELMEISRKANITLEARNTLTAISKMVRRCGGEISDKELGNTTLGDFAVIAAQNGLSIKVEPKPDYSHALKGKI